MWRSCRNKKKPKQARIVSDAKKKGDVYLVFSKLNEFVVEEMEAAIEPILQKGQKTQTVLSTQKEQRSLQKSHFATALNTTTDT